MHSLSILVPARNEAGTIETLVNKIPMLGEFTEIIFVEGHSMDSTWDEIQKQVKNPRKGFKIKGFKQRGKGKADAVDLGFTKAMGDIIVIFDSDLSVPPKDLIKFYNLLSSGKAQFANGSRFIYPKEKGAMKYLNHLGNKFFAYVFSVILRQRITDTLCGTKALFRDDYARIRKITRKYRKQDPYGDFQLLLGAAILGLKVKEIPIKYKARVYGKSNINPFIDGIKLIILLFKATNSLFTASKVAK